MTAQKTTVWTKIGTIGVDAGLCWVGDPCYIMHCSGDFPKSLGKNWNEFCDTLGDDNGNHLNHKSYNFDLGHEGLGCVVSTGWGDGSYPVEIRLDEETGRVAELRVRFIDSKELAP